MTRPEGLDAASGRVLVPPGHPHDGPTSPPRSASDVPQGILRRGDGDGPDPGADLSALHTAVDGLGPFDTEQQVLELAAVREVYAAFDRDPGPGKMAPHSLRMLLGALAAAGVHVGRYDLRIAEWLAGWEPATVAVIAGWVQRASQADTQAAARTGELLAALAITYPDRLPASAADIPEGRILVHNQVRPARRQGDRGFRFWYAPPGGRAEPCPCHWAPEAGPHYRIAPRGEAAP
jgi:hypothetical protein